MNIFLCLIAILGLVALGLCVWIYAHVDQHSQALMQLGRTDRPRSPYETAEDYERRGEPLTH